MLKTLFRGVAAAGILALSAGQASSATFTNLIFEFDIDGDANFINAAGGTVAPFVNPIAGISGRFEFLEDLTVDSGPAFNLDVVDLEVEFFQSGTSGSTRTATFTPSNTVLLIDADVGGTGNTRIDIIGQTNVDSSITAPNAAQGDAFNAFFNVDPSTFSLIFSGGFVNGSVGFLRRGDDQRFPWVPSGDPETGETLTTFSTSVERPEDQTVIPIPATLPLMLAGIGGLVLLRRRASA